MIDIDKSLGFYETVLRGVATRQRITAHNIANQNTPGYRSKELRFEEILGDAVKRGSDLRGVEFKARKVGNLPVKANGNDVNLEREWMSMESNKLHHDLFTRAAGSALRGLINAIRSR